MFTFLFPAVIFIYAYSAHRDLHSFPTRRSSDLQLLASQARLLAASDVNWDYYFRQPTQQELEVVVPVDRKSTRLNSSHTVISYAVFCLKKKNGPCGLPMSARPRSWPWLSGICEY